MVKFILVVSALLLWNCSTNKFVFEVKQLENRIYKMTMKTNIKSLIDFEAPQEILDKIKANGLQLPMDVTQEQVMVFRTYTNEKKDDIIPFQGSLDSISSIQYRNGELVEQSAQSGLDTSFTMSGYYKNGKTVIESIKGNGIYPSIEQSIKQAVEKMMASLNFPKEPIQIGDSFSNSIPVTIPVQGITNVNISITTHYKLMRIENNLAYFDIVQDFDLNSEGEKDKTVLKGHGNGKMVYDRNLFQMISMTTTSKIKMQAEKDNIIVIVNGDTTTEMDVYVKDAQ